MNILNPEDPKKVDQNEIFAKIDAVQKSLAREPEVVQSEHLDEERMQVVSEMLGGRAELDTALSERSGHEQP